jgi:hypothetical protein
MVEPTLCHRQFFWMSKPYVPVVSFILVSVDRPVCPTYTLARYDVNPWSPQCQAVLHRTEPGDLPRRQANAFDVAFGQHSVEPPVSRLDMRMANEVGLSFGLEFRTAGLMARRICLVLYPFSPKVVLRNSNSSWRLLLSHRALTLCTKVERTACMWNDGDVIQGSGRGLCVKVFGRPCGSWSH